MCKMSADTNNTEKIRTFNAKIVVIGTQEYHHFEIEWWSMEDDEYVLGFGSEDLNQVFDYLEEYFELVDFADIRGLEDV